MLFHEVKLTKPAIVAMTIVLAHPLKCFYKSKDVLDVIIVKSLLDKMKCKIFPHTQIDINTNIYVNYQECASKA